MEIGLNRQSTQTGRLNSTEFYRINEIEVALVLPFCVQSNKLKYAIYIIEMQ